LESSSSEISIALKKKKQKKVKTINNKEKNTNKNEKKENIAENKPHHYLRPFPLAFFSFWMGLLLFFSLQQFSWMLLLYLWW
jgi:hypothetical protein